MSRHQISTDPEVFVGWDHPMRTFFGHIYDEDGEFVAGHQSKSVDELALWCLAVPCVSLPDDTADALKADRNEPWQPGPLQQLLAEKGLFKS